MAIEPDGSAPYASSKSVVALIEGYRDKGYSTPFTPAVLAKAGVEESLINRTIATLKMLDLIEEDGSPTEQFEALKLARGDDEYKKRLAAWLTDVYAPILAYWNPATDPLNDLAHAFRGYKPEGQRLRMVSLMSALFKYAGIIEQGTSTAKVSKPVKRAPTKKSPSGNSGSGARSGKVNDNSANNGNGASNNFSPGDLPPSVAGLIQELPKNRIWTSTDRDDWLAAIAFMINRSYKVDNTPDSNIDNSQEDEQ